MSYKLFLFFSEGDGAIWDKREEISSCDFRESSNVYIWTQWRI